MTENLQQLLEEIKQDHKDMLEMIKELIAKQQQDNNEKKGQ